MFSSAHRARAEVILGSSSEYHFEDEGQAYIGAMIAALAHAVLALAASHEDDGYISVRRWKDAGDE